MPAIFDGLFGSVDFPDFTRRSITLSGFKVGLCKTSTLMKQANIVAINPKKKHYYANSSEVHRKACNVLNRQFNSGTIITHWVGYIMFIRTHCGWSYLACVLALVT